MFKFLTFFDGRNAKKSSPQSKFMSEVEDGNVFSAGGAQELRGKVRIKGSGNKVIIEAGAKFSGSISVSGRDSLVHIGKSAHFRGDILVKEGSGQTVWFGDHSTSVNVYILCQEHCDVRIGNWCMFSREIEIRTTDAHSVIDRKTLRRLNKPESITIGDHVWVGVGSIINKGAVIPSDSIVGAMSFVNGKFTEDGVIIAGMPAKVVKQGITWDRSRRDSFTPEQISYWK